MPRIVTIEDSDNDTTPPSLGLMARLEMSGTKNQLTSLIPTMWWVARE